jgi:addiction module RelE/StbE family toxin
MRVVWTPEAIARLDDIEAYVAQDSPANAREIIARLLQRARQLETVALSGREVPEYRREDIRELLERPYRIIYRVTPDRVTVLTVMHYRAAAPAQSEVTCPAHFGPHDSQIRRGPCRRAVHVGPIRHLAAGYGQFRDLCGGIPRKCRTAHLPQLYAKKMREG